MMIRGRGATSCLICDAEAGDTVINNTGIIYGIKLLFETDQYNIMLMSSKICIKCVGRLNQLFDFNLIKTNIDIHLGAERNQSEDCRFCNGTADMRGSFIDSVKKAVAATKWFEAHKTVDEIFCCFSCYNFLLFYAEVKKILLKERLQYYMKINSWQVIMTEVSGSAVAAVTTPSNVFIAEPSEDAATGCDETEQDITCGNPAAWSGQSTSTSKRYEPNNNEKQNSKEKQQQKSVYLKRLEFPSNNEQVESVDKFSSIKLRRSGKRPIVLTPANIKKKPFPTPKVIVKDEPAENQQTITCAELIAAPLGNLCDQSTVANASLDYTRQSVVEESIVITPTVKTFQANASTNEEPLTEPLSLPIDPLNIKAETCSTVQLSSETSTQDDSTEYLDVQAPVTLLFQSQSLSSHQSPVHFLSPEVETLNSFVPADVDLDLFPQLKDIGNEVILPEVKSTEVVGTDAGETISAKENIPDMKDLSIYIVRLDPVKLVKILGDRMPKMAKKSKSGRVWKPKIIIDPSTASHYKKKSLEKKIEAKKVKKRLKAIEKRDERSILKKLPTKHRERPPGLKPNKEPSFLTLQLPDEEFPTYQDIVEDFVDYSISDFDTIHPVPMEVDDDCTIVEVAPKRKEEVTKIEFLSPHYKHKGKDLLIIDGNLLKMVPSRSRSVRAVC